MVKKEGTALRAMVSLFKNLNKVPGVPNFLNDLGRWGLRFMRQPHFRGLKNVEPKAQGRLIIPGFYDRLSMGRKGAEEKRNGSKKTENGCH